VLIVDDILLFPAHSLMFILRGIQNAAQQELTNEADTIRQELRELYMMLETGRIGEKEFDERESALFDRLEATKGRMEGADPRSEESDTRDEG